MVRQRVEVVERAVEAEGAHPVVGVVGAGFGVGDDQRARGPDRPQGVEDTGVEREGAASHRAIGLDGGRVPGRQLLRRVTGTQ